MSGPSFDLLLHVTAAWFVIILAAQIFGWLAPRIGQPPVVGEMVAGVVLGPSLLGLVWPGASAELFPRDVKHTLFVIAMIGLSLYMFLVGVEHEHRPASKRAASMPWLIAGAGWLAPIVLGAGVAAILAGEFKPDGVGFWVFIVFVGGSLTVTAFPMLARILQERSMMHTDFGGVATRSAAIDDALAWCLLAVLSGIVKEGSAVGLVTTVLPALVFAALMFWLLPTIFRGPMQRAVAQGKIDDALFGGLLLLVLGAGWFTDYIGIYSVFGGFIAGLALPSVPGFSALINERLMQLVRVLLLPVFFAYSGLNTDITSITGGVVPALLMLLAAGFLSKTGATMAVTRAYGWSWGRSSAMGALMNARGLMILIFINIGLSMKVIDHRLFSALVVVAIVTTAAALPLYKLHFTPEREAAEREAAAQAAARAPSAGSAERSRRISSALSGSEGDMPPEGR